MAKRSKPKEVTVKLVEGVEGNSIYLNDYRIAGPKPWGGGKTLKEWTVTTEDIETALKQ
jgi:hypothetical protein